MLQRGGRAGAGLMSARLVAGADVIGSLLGPAAAVVAASDGPSRDAAEGKRMGALPIPYLYLGIAIVAGGYISCVYTRASAQKGRRGAKRRSCVLPL